jgi:hypothetical protein
MTHVGAADDRLRPMSDRASPDVASEASPRGPDPPLVRATRLAVGATLLAAAGVSAVVTQRTRGPDAHAPEDEATGGGPLAPPVAGALVRPLVVAARELDRATLTAVLVTAGLARTAVNVARLTPLRRWIDEAAAQLSAWSERGRVEGEIGANQLADVWDEVLGDIVAQVVRHVDVNDLAATVDVDAVVARVDVDRMLDRIDLDAVAQRIDVEAIVRRLDLAGIAQDVLDQIDVGDIIRESSGSLSVQTVDALRARGADADRRVAGVVDRLLQRRTTRDVVIVDVTDGPNGDDDPEHAVSTSPTEPTPR